MLSLPLAFTYADLSDNAGWKAQIEAAERLSRAGAIAPNLLLGLYTSQKPAASGGVWDRVAAFQGLDTAVAKGDVRAVDQEMPMPYGWGTGGVQLTASLLTPDDTLKVIDQGADDTTNAVSIRKFFVKTAGVATTTDTAERDHHPDPPPGAGTAAHRPADSRLPGADPGAAALPRAARNGDTPMHALAEYGVMHVKLYEDIARFGHIATSYAYPAKVNGRHVFDPSPIPKFDNPKLHRSAALQLFGAGREQRIYAVPPFTSVVSLDFEDHPFSVQGWEHACAQCGSTTSYLDEVVVDDQGSRLFVCSDTTICAGAAGRRSSQGSGEAGADDAREAAECSHAHDRRSAAALRPPARQDLR